MKRAKRDGAVGVGAGRADAGAVGVGKKVVKGLPAPLSDAVGVAPKALDAVEFRRLLMPWFREHARDLPWRGIDDPYATWLSEIMLQQTRVATVMERYVEFLRRFPTLRALAAAKEDDVLALWSGLGYYRRARMLWRAAQFVERELGGVLPETAAELKTLPGVGDYTGAAIASIAFGESVAVVDGNVERVLLRVTGNAEEKNAAGRARVAKAAQELVPAAARGGRQIENKALTNRPGDHNQAMMELGATICLPRGPLCLQCPVVSLCRTRGEHVTVARVKQKTRRVAHLLAMRTVGARKEVLLEQRPREASLMAGMFELPPLPLDAVTRKVPVLRVKHAITNTNYSVEVFAVEEGRDVGRATAGTSSLMGALPAAEADLHWATTAQLGMLPLTGLARKCLLRMGVMENS